MELRRHIKKDDFLEVVLEETPGSGCVWSMAPNDNFVVQKVTRTQRENKSYQELSNDRIKVVFFLRAKNFGEFTLRMVMKRPWEPNSPASVYEEMIVVE